MKTRQTPSFALTRSAILLSLATCLTLPQLASAAPILPAPDRASSNPGAELNRAREYMERQRVLRQIQEDQASRKEKVQGAEDKPFDADAKGITFELKKVTFVPASSSVLPQEDLDRVMAPYMNRKVTLDDLYALVEDINKLYAEKGFATCRAVLPPQRIHAGEVQIKLLEGKVGNITIQGNEHTRESYIRDRVSLQTGEVANIQELNKELRRFNGSNDAQMRIMMKAGEEAGTTDYDIQLIEPEKNQTISLYVDNAGYENNGRWRAGLLYSNRSLTGHRDHLNINYLHSEGSDIFGGAYSLPINTYGTRLDVNYSANSTEVVNGWMDKLGVKGHASSYGAALRHPLIVDEDIRVETGLEWQHQESMTSLFVKTSNRQKWIDDRTTRIVPYVSFTHYGDNTVLYHRHGVNFGHYKNIDGDTKDYEIYNLDGLFYWKFGDGQMIQTRLTGQEAFTNYLSSAEKFYLGGVSSVRGYEESLISGDSGLSGSVEYSHPLTSWVNGLSAYAFLDAGTVWGDSAYGDKTLVGAGFGFRYSLKNWLNVDIGMGVPLKRTINDDQQDQARLHFMLSATY
jgi:hemolysin activation/secretion protein